MRIFGNPKDSKDSKKDEKKKEKFSLFKEKKEEKKEEPVAEATPEPKIEEAPKKPSSNKTVQFIEEIKKLENSTIKPFVDFNEGILFYPVLGKIGERQDNLAFLEVLVEDGVLDKKVGEKLVVCPMHADNFSSSVRLYCTKCNSVNVEKLNLYEHRQCGHICESTDFNPTGENATCPGCNKKIVNFEKQIRVPAMWYQCEDCSAKSDTVTIKLHCRKYDHDFDLKSARFEPVYDYFLKDEDQTSGSEVTQIKDEIVNMLKNYEFHVERNANVTGNSGNTHYVPIFARSKASKNSLLLFTKGPHKIDESDVNAILVPMLDIAPTGTILVTTSEVPEHIEKLANQYKIKIISDSDMSKIPTHVETFMKESLKMVEAREK